MPLDNKGTVQDSLLLFQRVIDEDITYIAATISSVANALTDAMLKHNTRNPNKRVLFLDFDARDPSGVNQASRNHAAALERLREEVV